MAEECRFYYYESGDYCCLKKKARDDDNYTVDDDWVHKYCWGYNYDDCPVYKNDASSSSSACYLTSACVISKGLPDNCEELETLRNFRDTYMKYDKSMCCDIKHYYDVAPSIVENINKKQSAKAIWEQVYDNMILPCVELIKKGKLADAYRLYKEYSITLEEEYN